MNKKSFFVFLMVVILIVLGVYFFTVSFSGFSVFENHKLSPGDYIHDEDIAFFEGEIILNTRDFVLSRYEDTRSMEPFLTSTSVGIEITDFSEGEIGVGDVISFRKGGMLLIHRVIEKGVDEEGVYFVTKGDNNGSDDGKVRFENIEGVLVGVLY